VDSDYNARVFSALALPQRIIAFAKSKLDWSEISERFPPPVPKADVAKTGHLNLAQCGMRCF
jgi:hypothetical protein